MTRTQTSNALSWHYSISLCAVGSFAVILPPTSSVAQTVQGTPAANRAEESPPLDPRTLSCDALKDRLQRMGGAGAGPGRQGWGETFYTVPQCEFWAKPSFAYVSASDGACGLGYLCQWKPGAGSGR